MIKNVKIKLTITSEYKDQNKFFGSKFVWTAQNFYFTLSYTGFVNLKETAPGPNTLYFKSGW